MPGDNFRAAVRAETFRRGRLLHGLRQTGSTLLAKVGSLRIIGPAIGAAMRLFLGFPAGTFLGLGTFEGGFLVASGLQAAFRRLLVGHEQIQLCPYLRIVLAAIRLIYLPS